MIRAIRPDLHQHHVTRCDLLAVGQRAEPSLGVVVHVEIAGLARLPPTILPMEIRQRYAPLSRVPVPHEAVAVQDPMGEGAAKQRRLVALRREANQVASQYQAGIILRRSHNEPWQARPLAGNPVRFTWRRRRVRMRMHDGSDPAGLFRCGVIVRIEDKMVRAFGQVAAGTVVFAPPLDHHQATTLARVLRHRVSANGVDCLLAHGYPLMRSAEGKPPKLITSYSPKRFLQSVSRPEHRSKAGSVTGRPSTSNMRAPVYPQYVPR
ncbi:hypothetical protein D3C71_1256060 [compost metagenome]